MLDSKAALCATFAGLQCKLLLDPISTSITGLGTEHSPWEQVAQSHFLGEGEITLISHQSLVKLAFKNNRMPSFICYVVIDFNGVNRGGKKLVKYEKEKLG